MIDDLAPLKEAMSQMDAEDPVVAQAAKDRAAQALSDARLSFSKMADLIEQRRLLLRPRIVAGIKRMDQPGMLGDAAFRDAGSALRREGQSFGQIAEALELAGPGPASRYEDPVRRSEPLHPIESERLRQIEDEPPHPMPNELGMPAWLRALMLVGGILFFPLRHPIRFIGLVLLAMLLFYTLRGVTGFGQWMSRDVTDIGHIRQSTDDAMSSINSFIHKYILPRSEEAPPPVPPAPIPSPSAVAPSPSPAPSPTPPATPTPTPTPSAAGGSAPPASTPAPSATAAPAPPAAAPAPRSAAPAGPPVSRPRRDARGGIPPRSAANCAVPWDNRYPQSCLCEPLQDDRSGVVESERPRVLDDVIPDAPPRNSSAAGPCFGGVGGCAWGGDKY